MPNKIQDIIDKFDKEFPETTVFQHRVFHIGTGHQENRDVLIGKDIKQFLQSSLTSLLDSLEKELPPISYTRDVESTYRNRYRQEVINIINSHR